MIVYLQQILEPNSFGYAGDIDYVYLWHDVPGFPQKFGIYANANADGPYVELGFRPAILWTKGVLMVQTTGKLSDQERKV